MYIFIFCRLYILFVMLLLHPCSLPFFTKGAKSLCAEFTLNILYLTEIMQDFFSVKKQDVERIKTAGKKYGACNQAKTVFI